MGDNRDHDLVAPDTPWHTDDDDNETSRKAREDDQEPQDAGSSAGTRLMGRVQDLVDQAREYTGRKVRDMKDPLKRTVGEAAGDLIVEGSHEVITTTGKVLGKGVKETVLLQDDPRGYVGRRMDSLRSRLRGVRERTGEITEDQLDHIRTQHDRLQELGTGDYLSELGDKTNEAATGLGRRVQETIVGGLEDIASDQSFHPNEIIMPGSDVAIGTYRQGSYLTDLQVQRTKAFVFHLEDDPEFIELGNQDVRRQIVDLYIGFAETDPERLLKAAYQNPDLGGRADDSDGVLRAVALIQTQLEFFEHKLLEYSAVVPEGKRGKK